MQERYVVMNFVIFYIYYWIVLKNIKKMVNIEPSDEDLEEYDKILSDIPKAIEDTPIAPEDLQDKKYKKEVKEWKRKLRAQYLTNRINKVIALKKKYKQTMTDVEKEFIYKPAFKEKWGKILLKKEYLRIMIIMPYGSIKEFNKSIKHGAIEVMKGTYQVNMKCIIRYKGKPTLFYHHNNPHPIKFSPEEYPYLIDAESLRQMFNANIVSQIFATMDFKKAAVMTVGIILAFGLVGIIGFAVVKDSLFPPQTAGLFLLIPRWYAWKV